MNHEIKIEQAVLEYSGLSNININTYCYFMKKVKIPIACLFFSSAFPFIYSLIQEKQMSFSLNNWGRVTHICVGELTTISADNGLPPGRRQSIIWANDGILLTPRNTARWNLNRNSYSFIQENVFVNIVCKMAAISARPQCVKDRLAQIAIVTLLTLLRRM